MKLSTETLDIATALLNMTTATIKLATETLVGATALLKILTESIKQG